MAKLPSEFPGFAALDAAGEATHAKVRKRIADNTLTEIDGIGDATAEKIAEAFEEIDTPDHQAKEMIESEDDETRTPASDAEAGKIRAETVKQPGEEPVGGTLLNTGTSAQEIEAKSAAMQNKTGAQRSRELDNHALDKPTSAERASNQAAATEGQRLANSGVIYVDAPTGAYAQKGGEKHAQEDGRIKVLPIAQVSPQKGMEVRDGDDVYVIQESIERDSTPMDWLRVRSPNTGKPLVD